MNNFSDKVAFITGGAQGIGKLLAKKLLQRGALVYIVDINPEILQNTIEELSQIGKIFGSLCDITDKQQLDQISTAVLSKFGSIDLLINNAGIVKADELVNADETIIEKTIEVNLLAQFWIIKRFLPSMIKRNTGHIINISSAGGILGIPNLSAYNASKFGVIGLSEALRQEMKKHNYKIEVSVVCPNTINTGMFGGSEMVKGTKMLQPEEVVQGILKGIKRKRPVIGIPHFSVTKLTPFLKLFLGPKNMDKFNKKLGMWSINDTWKGH
ncbi:SDR family NAD(P)-dependent oxidoreductase [Candidatus Lokiarchaeum ossiferum]|uniref:SDR family NAD(P)-dependent oxidoreductase n=1 Tax=Candidatus Lokiarchaeum ossiferum TaxID=2951803 RepID=UPI00352BF109